MKFWLFVFLALMVVGCSESPVHDDRNWSVYSLATETCRDNNYTYVDGIPYNEAFHEWNGSVWFKCFRFSERTPYNNFQSEAEYSGWIEVRV